MLVTQSCLTLCYSMDCGPSGLCPWDSPGKNTGMGCHALLQGILPTQGSNPGLLHSRQIFFTIWASWEAHNKTLAFLSEKAMATHSSTLAWKIPWTEGPGRLQSMGSLGVGQDWATSLSLFTFMHWRRKWQPTPVFLPGESRGRRAWWAAVYGVAQSRIRLKWLSSSSIFVIGISEVEGEVSFWKIIWRNNAPRNF